MALIVRECIYGENKPLRDIVENSYRATAQVFSGDNQWHRFAELMDLALSLSRNSSADITNIRSIGSGTTGDTALAISVYCSLKYEHDFSGGIIAAVNQDGDSDSTGAITGNLLGAYLGLDNIENKWLDKLERKRQTSAKKSPPEADSKM